MRALLVALLLRIVDAGILELAGKESYITMGGGHLSMSCDDSAARLSHVWPLQFGTLQHNDTVLATLIDVPPHCSGKGLDTPCVASSASRPPRETSDSNPSPVHTSSCSSSHDRATVFYCNFEGSKGMRTTGPMYAHLEEHRTTKDELIEMSVLVTCPIGAVPNLYAIAPGTVNVTVSFGLPDAIKMLPMHPSATTSVSFEGDSYLVHLGIDAVEDLHRLTSINYQGTGLTNVNCINLANTLAIEGSTLVSVTTLDLSHNPALTDVCASALGTALAVGALPKLTNLNLAKTNIGPAGLAAIFAAPFDTSSVQTSRRRLSEMNRRLSEDDIDTTTALDQVQAAEVGSTSNGTRAPVNDALTGLKSLSFGSNEISQFEHTMACTTLVLIDGTAYGQGKLAAFSQNGDICGLQDQSDTVPFGPYMGQPIFMVCHALLHVS